MKKRCTCCHKTKPRDRFHRDRTREDKLSRRCKNCTRAAQKKGAGSKTVNVKRCPECGETKQADCFYKDRSRPDSLAAYCKQCSNDQKQAQRKSDPGRFQTIRTKASQTYSEKNPEKCRRAVRNSTLKKKYGITTEDYEEMVERQRSVCAICGTTPERILDVDHDHATGKVRGLLCSQCNVGLGCFKDDPIRLFAAIDYLELGVQG